MSLFQKKNLKGLLTKINTSLKNHLPNSTHARVGLLSLFTVSCVITFAALLLHVRDQIAPEVKAAQELEENYWFVLHRKSDKEFLYYGPPGQKEQSTLIREFFVNSGVSGKKPTPLPQLLGKEYWIITEEYETPDDPETSPYFLALNIPTSELPPFGPTPYEECNGQCDWEVYGLFGLHGVAGVPTRLEDEGSSGCIRHSDEDIVYLYNLLNPKEEEIRYYIEDI